MADNTDIDWDSLARAVTYQVRTSVGWATITREAYRNIHNPDNRRILIKAERKIINSTLLDTKI